MALHDMKVRVVNILAKYPATRDSDDFLYYKVAQSLIGESKVSQITFEDFILNRKKLGLPNTETIRRTRQKAQEEHPELRASTDTMVKRRETEDEFLEFARNG